MPPLLAIVKRGAVEEPTAKYGEVEALALTESTAHGEVEPMPTTPVLEIEKRVEEAPLFDVEPMAKSVWLVSVATAKTESLAKGEVVPIPTFELVPINMVDVPAEALVPVK